MSWTGPSCSRTCWRPPWNYCTPGGTARLCACLCWSACQKLVCAECHVLNTGLCGCSDRCCVFPAKYCLRCCRCSQSSRPDSCLSPPTWVSPCRRGTRDRRPRCRVYPRSCRLSWPHCSGPLSPPTPGSCWALRLGSTAAPNTSGWCRTLTGRCRTSGILRLSRL